MNYFLARFLMDLQVDNINKQINIIKTTNQKNNSFKVEKKNK